MVSLRRRVGDTGTMKMTDAAGLLGAGGPFARQFKHFVPRPVQQRLADAVGRALAARDTLVVEAGTGTGKTFAYLVPAVLSGKQVVVSTGTKALQDQLFHRDLPRVREVLGEPFKASLLKGRSNYLCLYRMQQMLEEPPPPGSRLAGDLGRVQAWSHRTNSGDRMELTGVPDDASIWPHVTSTVDNCLGTECPFYDQCWVYKARRQAQEADVIVVNHHLLLADMALKLEGVGEILPDADAFILDEAHQIPALAGQFFSRTLSARQLRELIEDGYREAGQVSAATAQVREPLGQLDAQLKKTTLAMHGLADRGTFAAIEANPAALQSLQALEDTLAVAVGSLAELAQRSQGLENLHQRASDLSLRLTRMLQAMPGAARADDADEAGAEDRVCWYETRRYGFVLNLTPLDLATPLQRMRESSGAAWIFTSATLSVARRFDHFADQMGLANPRTECLESPFDYNRQALLYLPRDLPEPRHPDYTDAVVEAMRPVLDAAGGRTFFLFTSHRALRRAAQLLREDLPFPLLVQGEQPRSQLLDEFRRSGNAVLLGAASFWQGVDVAGEALSCVIIDKLPFAAPGDPVHEARRNAVQAAGNNPFFDMQVPEAVITLKQGCGRLVRSINDRGVLVLCDPRLVTKGYGRQFLDSLPTMPRTSNLGDVAGFFDQGVTA